MTNYDPELNAFWYLSHLLHDLYDAGYSEDHPACKRLHPAIERLYNWTHVGYDWECEEL
jgi:hypothetical protein